MLQPPARYAAHLSLVDLNSRGARKLPLVHGNRRVRTPLYTPLPRSHPLTSLQPLTSLHTLTSLHPLCQGLAGKTLGGSAAEVKAALKKAMWNPAPDAPRA